MITAAVLAMPNGSLQEARQHGTTVIADRVWKPTFSEELSDDDQFSFSDTSREHVILVLCELLYTYTRGQEGKVLCLLGFV